MESDNKKSGRTKKQNQKNKRSSEAGLSQTSAADENVIKARHEADKDIEEDPDLSAHNPKDDLDEEETVKRDDGQTPLM